MVTASYCTPAMQDLHKDALEAGITIVNEVSILELVSKKLNHIGGIASFFWD